MRSLLLGIPFVLLVKPVFTASGLCYFPNGSPISTTDNFYGGFKPCSAPGAPTICCATNRTNPAGGDNAKGWTQDECLPNGLCQNRSIRNGVPVTYFFVDYCTDSNYTSGACLNICSQTRAPTGNVQMTSCSGRADSDEWCCGVNNTACCGGGVDVVKLPQKFLAFETSSRIISSASPSSSRTQSISASSTSSLPPSSTPASSSSSSSSSLSVGAIVGITIGVVAIFFSIAIGILLCLRKKKHVVPQASSYVPAPAPHYPPAYEVGSGQEVAIEKYASQEPVELMAPPSELPAGGSGNASKVRALKV